MQTTLRFLRCSACLIGLLILSSTLHAQQAGGVISGLVRDQTGAIIRNAPIRISNDDTAATISLLSNGNGSYTTPSLPIGSYSVSVRANGFRPEERKDVVVDVDSKVIIDFSLQPGAVSETVVVSSGASQVELANSALGSVVTERTIQDMPINGRSVLALEELMPGVHINSGPVNEGFADRGTALAAVSINNSPNAMNAGLIDGQNNVQTYYPELMLNPSGDAIAEFKIQTATMPAEYGFTAGGAINLATRSGKDVYHGSIYEFFRNNVLNSRNYFVRAPLNPPVLRYNQFGGTIGGPILKTKLQFFANYEGYQYIASTSVTASVPTQQQRAGDFSATFDVNHNLIKIYDPTTTSGNNRTQYPGNIIPANELDPVALNIQNFYPLPNTTPTNVNTQSNNFQVLAPSARAMRQGFGRLDYALSPKQHLFARYGYYYNYFNNGADAYSRQFPVVGVRNDNDRNQLALLEDTYIFSSSLINELRLSLGRVDLSFAAASANQGWPQKLGLPGNVPATTFPIITGNGLPAFQTGTVGFRAATNPEVSDVVTIVRGAHSIRTGLDWRINRGSNIQTSSPSGNFAFTSSLTGSISSPTGTGSPYASFLAGAVSSATEVLTLGETERNYSVTGFIDDQWRLLPRLDDPGVRYDYQRQPQEMDNGVSNFNPNIVNPLNGFQGAMQYAGVGGAPDAFQETNYLNISPRVGFAWDVYGGGRTSLRGGYGIYYPSIFSTPFFGNTQGFAATTTTYSSIGPSQAALYLKNGFPAPPTQPLGGALGPSAFLGQSVAIDLAHAPTPMSQQWNLSVEQAMPGKIVLDIAYAGNHGTHFAGGNVQLNQLNPQYLSLGNQLLGLVPNPYAGRVPGALGNATVSLQQTLLAFPYYSAVTVRYPHNGNYIGHAMLLSATRRQGDNLTLTMAYTWSKLLDGSIQTPLNFGAVTQAAVVGYQNNYNERAERGLDPLDISQFFKSSVVWSLPVGHGQHFAAKASSIENALVGGWQLNSVVTIHAGLPLTITGANNNAATRPNFVPGVSPHLDNRNVTKWFNTAAFANPPSFTFGNVPRTLGTRGPGVFVANLSLFKNLTLSDRFKAQFRVECFNVFNHPNFYMPNMTFVPGTNGLNSSGTFGTITNASDPRVYQLALKLSF